LNIARCFIAGFVPLAVRDQTLGPRATINDATASFIVQGWNSSFRAGGILKISGNPILETVLYRLNGHGQDQFGAQFRRAAAVGATHTGLNTVVKRLNQNLRWGFATWVALLGLEVAPARADGIPEPDLILYGAITQRSANQATRLTLGTITWTFQPGGGGPVTVSAPLTNINDQFSYVLRVRCETVMPAQTLSSNALLIAPGSYTYNRAQVFVNGTNPATFIEPSQAAITLSAVDRGRIEQVDFRVVIGMTDTDGDGLPDDWERRYFGGQLANPFADPDGDGMNNLAEYQAGTDPTDPNSRFAFIRARTHPQGGIEIEWASVSGGSYDLQRSSDLLSGFIVIQSSIPATGQTHIYRDGTATGTGPYFYRLRLHE
jgi:hypothetical protein